MPRYPFAFIQADALRPPVRLEDFDLIWASPPCQHASFGTAKWRNLGKSYPQLIDATRKMLKSSGVPFIIENVIGAAIRPDIILTGEMFGMNVIRRRHFELGGWWYFTPPRPFVGKVKNGDFCTVAGHGGDAGKGRTSLVAWRKAMDIDWMLKDELAEAVLPAYAEFIGRAAISYINRSEKAA
jgi:DNA (cytosine-5)-methyltransferase 1